MLILESGILRMQAGAGGSSSFVNPPSEMLRRPRQADEDPVQAGGVGQLLLTLTQLMATSPSGCVAGRIW
jgi:hypothetical protein